MKRMMSALVGLTLLPAAIVILTQTGKGQELLRIASYAQIINLRIALKHAGESVAFDSDAIRIMGSLYRPQGAAFLPAIVLIHGSTPAGRKLPLYVMLAKELATRGYVVLSIDLRGFGESEDPKNPDRSDSWDASRDIGRAIDYLRFLNFVDPSKIYLIGHSMGGSYAVATAAADQRIRKIVAIGPSRRVYSRVLAKDAPDQRYFHERFSRDRMLENALPIDAFLKIVSTWQLERYLDYFSGNHHQPIFLIDGALERPEDLSYLKGFYERMSTPKHYLTLPNSDHYSNTMEIGSLIFYDRGAFSRLVEVIDQWLKESPRSFR
jgi:pimeloyl-ACP methyl ester carboxylesterase